MSFVGNTSLQQPKNLCSPYKSLKLFIVYRHRQQYQNIIIARACVH
jgi:hypothetical protein